MPVERVTEIIGISSKNWDDAAVQAYERAKKTIRGITSFEVVRQTAKVEKGGIKEYRALVKITFVVED
ncbi:MAG: dodecin domain-containing protein [Nitrospirae bacterium]|nr:dodecin domain-containing protein [Nitrospirota bacterium]